MILGVVYGICRLAIGNTYTLYHVLPYYDGQAYLAEQLQIVPEEDVVFLESVQVQDRLLTMKLRANHPGKTFLVVHDLSGEPISLCYVKVGAFLTIYDLSSSGFTGDAAALIMITLFWLLCGCIMGWHFLQAKGPLFYSYSTIYYSGAAMFSLVTFMVMLYVSFGHILSPEANTMFTAIGTINGAARQFMILTTPLLLAFSVAMAISNLALIRHEGRHVQNALGLLVSLLLASGLVLGWYLFTRDFSGSEWQGKLIRTFENVYATAFVYCECMLAGSIVCGIRAGRGQPEMDQDFIVILGCWFREDGTLPPLLKGRVDRAVEFWYTQKEKTGKEAILIPSGGQGSNETMAEGEAMRRYMLTQKIPDNRIIAEVQSRTTFENMAFSRKIIETIQKSGKTIFVTTNYHVFRSGIWASSAGLQAEGLGSRTKWWFWPNAFIRECLGLLQKRWKQEILFLFTLMAFYGILSLLL